MTGSETLAADEEIPATPSSAALFISHGHSLSHPTTEIPNITLSSSTHPVLWRRLAVGGFLLTLCLASLLAFHAFREQASFRLLLVIRFLAASSGVLTLFATCRALARDASTVAHGSALWGRVENIPAIRYLPAEQNPLTDPGAKLPPETVLLGGTAEGGAAVLTAPLLRQHGVVFGPSGTGKTRGYFLPNAALQQGMSILCTDPKSELWHYTAGQYPAPHRYAPVEPDASRCFNWVPLCTDPRFAELCARTLIEAGEHRTRPVESVWIELETAFLAALFAHAATLPEPTPLTAYRLFTRQKQEDLLSQLAASTSEVAQEQSFIFAQTQERMRGSIVPAVAAKLQFLRDPRIARFTSAETVPPDLGRLRQNQEAVYWCLPEQDVSRLRPLSALFFTLALDQITRAPLEDDAEGVTVLCLLDEIANIGVVPHFDTTIALARSRGLSLWLGLQSLSQLEDRYGKPAAATILANCATRIALAGLDPDSAEYVSRLLGQATLTLSQPSWGLSHVLGRTTGVNYHRATLPRPLLTPDEVRRLGNDEALVILANHAPLRLRKYWYALAPETIDHPGLGPARCVSPTPSDAAPPAGTAYPPQPPGGIAAVIKGKNPITPSIPRGPKQKRGPFRANR